MHKFSRDAKRDLIYEFHLITETEKIDLKKKKTIVWLANLVYHLVAHYMFRDSLVKKVMCAYNSFSSLCPHINNSFLYCFSFGLLTARFCRAW